MEIKKFKGRLIAFDFDNDMVNATDMAKEYGKKPADFLRLEHTKLFIKELDLHVSPISDVSENHNVSNQIVRTVKGGDISKISQGTWMCELLAYKFAAWLDPKFEIFVYETFRNTINDKIRKQQYQLDYFWDKSDMKDLYS